MHACRSTLEDPTDHPHDSDLVEVDGAGHVVAVHPYPHPEGAVYRNLVNAALYVLESAPLEAVIAAEGKSDLAKHTFPAMLAGGLTLRGYVTPEYIKDMGTPERLDKVAADIVAGLPERLSPRQPRRAVFLDRDGTLNVEVGHLNDPRQLALIDNAGDAVRAFNRAGWLAVGVTNQPVLARGDVSRDGLERIHATLDHLLGRSKAYLDRIYVCPHHPDKGFAGEVAALKIACTCRKPESGLIDQAVRELDISRRDSWMVGDATSDIHAGARAGLRTILVRTGHAGLDGRSAIEADYVMPDLAAAAQWILHGHAQTARQLLAACRAAADARLVLVGGPSRAGKSCAARVLQEQLCAIGRTAHVFALDGWLRPAEQRVEGASVLARYDLAAFRAAIEPVLGSRARHALRQPIHERRSRRILPGPVRSIGPDDAIIVEGVPALMDDFLVASAAVRVFVDASDAARHERLRADYAWRGEESATIEARIASRDVDEVPAAQSSAASATHHLSSSPSP